MSVVCCQVEVSTSGCSLVWRSPIVCDLSECDLEASIMRRPWPARDCYAMGGGGSSSLSFGTVKNFKIYNSYFILHLTECRFNSLAGLRLDVT